MIFQPNPLQYEDQIVWIKESVGVREKIVLVKNRARRIAAKGGKVVGYSILMAETPPDGDKMFKRRVFFEDENGIAPSKILPGVRIEKLDKS